LFSADRVKAACSIKNQPALIDFGIDKATTGQRLTDKTIARLAKDHDPINLGLTW